MRYPPFPALLLAVLSLLPAPCPAAGPAPIEGRWVTFDGETKQKAAIVEIARNGTHASGRIVEFFPQPGEEADPVCTKCPGADRGRKIRGLAILSLQAEEGGAKWRGTVLDPDEGRVYRCVATFKDGGRQLNLLGYVGIELFGRSETWIRAD